MSPENLRVLRWVSGGLEAFLGIPIIGGTIILSLNWVPLLAMLILHILIVVVNNKQGLTAYGNILGIVTSCIGWIPVVGMIMHIVTAIVIFLEIINNPEKMMDGSEM